MVNHEEDLTHSTLSGRRQSQEHSTSLKFTGHSAKGRLLKKDREGQQLTVGGVGKEGCSKLELFRNARIVLYFDCSHSNRGGHMP